MRNVFSHQSPCLSVTVLDPRSKLESPNLALRRCSVPHSHGSAYFTTREKEEYRQERTV